MSRSDVDELFDPGEALPAPRRRLVLGLLVSGMMLAVLGMACSAAPGGLMVLAAWGVVETDLDRVASGYLAPESGPEVRRLRAVVFAGLIVVIALFLIQGWLLARGAYDGPWSEALNRLASWLAPPAPDAAAP